MTIETKKKYNVLYVDDEEHNLNSFRAAFRRYFNVYTCISAKEGLEILQNNNIHLLVTDQRMPEMTGVQFLESCVNEYPEMIRMILTGYSDVQDIIEAINTGRVYRYITKPWDENDLKITIDKALESYELRRKNTKLLMEVQENERKFRSMVSNSSDIISIVNNEGIYSFVSPSVTDVLGYEPEELENKIVFDYIHQDDIPLVKETFLLSLNNPGTTHGAEFRFRHKNGDWIYLDSKGSFIERNGNLEAIINSRDVTERRRSEQLLREKEIAMESGKLKERFLANMSHEIRTPMNAVMGITNLMLKTSINDVQQKYLSAIKQSSENLLIIINDILDFSKIEAGKIDFEFIVFELKEVLDGVMNTLRFKAEEKGLNLSYSFDENLPEYLQGDPLRLNQILLNLAGNAVKFTEKGSVKIQCRANGKKNDNKTNVEFEVTDTGIGIPENKINSVFESFSQAGADTTRKYGGTGLGLTISKQLVESQGGKIDIKSTLGKGTIFRFSIPFHIGSEKDAVPEENTLTSDQISFLKKLKILIAEDNEFNRLVAVSTLESVLGNVHIDVAENGKIAINKLEQSLYDIVLMDVQMPVMGGYEAADFIRKEMKSPMCHIPIIAFTANISQPEVDKCRESGMNDYVSKPFKEYDLLFKMYSLVKNSNLSEKNSHVRKDNSVSSNLISDTSPRLTNLDVLHKLSKGNKKYVKDMIEIFIEQTISSMDVIKQGLEGNDFEKIGGIAHRMRPSFGFMGINYAPLLIQIEEISMNLSGDHSAGGKEKIPALCSELVSICNKALSELNVELRSFS